MRLIVIVFSVLCCLVVSSTNSDAEIDPKTAVGVWLFNETAGGTVHDSSGNGNDGKLEGDPKWVPDGKFGNVQGTPMFKNSADFSDAPDRV